jgi:hypothetical protein
MPTMEHFEELERRFEDLLGTLASQGWTDAELAEIRHFIAVGEYGVALETLAWIFVEEGKRITPDLLAAVERLAGRMELRDSEALRALRVPAGTDPRP